MDLASTRFKVLQVSNSTKYAHNVYGALTPMNVINGKMIRKGRDGDGGYIMLDEIDKNSIAYSFGISGDVSWGFGYRGMWSAGFSI